MAEQEIRVPMKRIGALIGKRGETKRLIEEKTGVTIYIDSDEGMVTIDGEDTIGVMNASDVVTAISRGFSPERAFTLLEDEDFVLDLIDLSDLSKSQKQLERYRGRIIGKEGRARDQIEDLTGIMISVYGKTVALIGTPEQINTTRTAIDMLIRGVPHEAVYSFLDKKKKEAKIDILGYYY